MAMELNKPASLTEELECPVCLDFFRDPVMLECGHNICRPCILKYMNSQRAVQCPECRAAVNGPGSLVANRALRNLADKARAMQLSDVVPQGASKSYSEVPATAPPMQTEPLCARHGQMLQLYSDAEQRPVCGVCVQEARALGLGYSYRPIAEVVAACKAEVNGALQFLVKDNQALHHLETSQVKEIAKVQDDTNQLMLEIAARFSELQEFLRRREEELKRELKLSEKNVLEQMERNLEAIQRAENDGSQRIAALQSIQESGDPVSLLKWWTNTGYPLIENMKQPSSPPAETDDWEIVSTSGYKSQVKDLGLHPGSVSLGPIETHLQFFVWKEMLKVIKTVPQRLTLEDCSGNWLKISRDGCSVRQYDQRLPNQENQTQCSTSPPFCEAAFDVNLHATSSDKFSSGKHYWEVEVGGKSDWALGVKLEKVTEKNSKWYKKLFNLISPYYYVLLAFTKDKNYHIKAMSTDIPVVPAGRPRKVGVHLDCDKATITFYNADDMSLIYTYDIGYIQSALAYFNPGPYCHGRNTEPLKVCWY
ncbi:nuclear factor 7, brain-like [Erpetoichthys calabaricus]|uniref:nuclear factor 7, brain-like n=1 Tax=Erpetoichthys calabaricus TaxID=27687 RepID=UPI002234E761|nr:nuclear factor 7, brain-like [Erpetoichthys calabaricus]